MEKLSNIRISYEYRMSLALQVFFSLSHSSFYGRNSRQYTIVKIVANPQWSCVIQYLRRNNDSRVFQE